MRRAWLLLTTGLFFLCGCNEFQQAVKDAKKEMPPPVKDNYIVLLDLSDRILYNNQQQVPKDVAVIKSVYGLFKAGLDSKDPTHLYYPLRDKLKVLIAPQKTTPKVLYDMVGSLRIDLSSEQPDKKASVVDETQKTFANVLPDVYKQAVIGNNSTAYSGADIWKYFNEDLTDDLEKDGQNTLFIVTDGYMDLEKADERPSQNNRYASCSQVINALKKYPDWETKFTDGDFGILPVKKKFPNLKIVLLQVNPKEDWNGEYSLLTKIWGKWFSEMGVSNYRFIKDDNINEVKESLEKFMDLKIAGKIHAEPWTRVTEVDSTLMISAASAAQPDTVAHHATLLAAEKIIQPAKKPAAKTSTSDVPDESDTGLLTPTHTARQSPQKTTKEDDDILRDGTPANGFNTGIRRDVKKDPLAASRHH